VERVTVITQRDAAVGRHVVNINVFININNKLSWNIQLLISLDLKI